MELKLKVCGMKFPENILETAQLAPDYLGFIFYEKSPRNFEEKIPNWTQKNIKKVGVFVNASPEEIFKKIAEFDLDIIQLHGDESAEFCKTINKKIPVIKAFSIDSEFDFQSLNQYNSSCDYFLFDTKGKNPGGNGLAFEWSLLKKYKLDKPYFLSGGISLENSTKLLEFLKKEALQNCVAIDINSQFETQPGLKNTKKIKTLKLKL